jgi:hypothetical protein
MARRLVSVLAAAVVAAGSLVAVAEPVSATIPYCPSGWACLWKDIHYSTAGSAANYFANNGSVRNLGNWSYPGGNGTVWRSASSEYNSSTTQYVYYYKGASCTGAGFSSVPQSGDSDFTNGSPPGDFQDAIESMAFEPKLSACHQ